MLWVFCLREPLQMLGLFQYPIAAVCALWPALYHDNGNAIPLADWKIGIHIIFSAAVGRAADTGIAAGAGNSDSRPRSPSSRQHRGGPSAAAAADDGAAAVPADLRRLLPAEPHAAERPAVHSTTCSASTWSTKPCWSIAAWLLFGVAAVGDAGATVGADARHCAGRLSGYALLVLAYFGSKFVLEQLLGTHWT